MFIAASTFVLFALAFVNVDAVIIPSVTLPRSLSTINNCSGDVPPIPAGDNKFSVGYGPQITGPEGWETWTFVLPGVLNDSLSVFTWTRGDPACPFSDPDSSALFSVFSSHDGFSATLKDEFVYTYVDGIFSISIGDNRLVYDGTYGPYGVWNASVNIDGLELDVSTVPITPNFPFTPTYHGVTSQLVDGYFTNIAVTRGHADGPLKHPSGEIWQVHDVSTIRHTYATKPIQSLVSSYVRGSSYVVLTTLHWFQAESVKHEKVEATQLLVGVSDTDIPVTYQAMDDPSIFKISTKEHNTTVTLAGCDATEENPFVLAGYSIAYRGAFVDSAGGKTEYYSTLTNASIWSGDALYVGNDSQGILEIYTSPDGS